MKLSVSSVEQNSILNKRNESLIRSSHQKGKSILTGRDVEKETAKCNVSKTLSDCKVDRKNDKTAPIIKSVPETAGGVPKQCEGKYVVGSLSRLFGSFPISSSAEGIDRTVNEGESVIKPKKRKGIVNDTEGSKGESNMGSTYHGNCRVQQRENRKKASEKRISLDETKRTIFIGNAPLSMNERSCKKLFSQYGEIESVRRRSIIPSKETITKRIAHLSHSLHENQTSAIFYVKFKDEESVQKALSYNGRILERHRVRVDTCVSKAEYDKNFTVFVGNIPLDTKEDDLANFFEDNVGCVDFVRCVKDQSSGIGKGFAFVIFKSQASVPLAISMAGSLFRKRELRIMRVMKKNKLMKLRSTVRRSHSASNLTKEQLTRIEQHKFSTRKLRKDKVPTLKKTARKAIRRKKTYNNAKSIMH